VGFYSAFEFRLDQSGMEDPPVIVNRFEGPKVKQTLDELTVKV
jgi:hypothetical protein